MSNALIEEIMIASEQKPQVARERILATSMRLFYRDGIRATGIDKIIAESGVAKMSFYRHFPSKADLVAAFLQKRHEDWMAWFASEVEAKLSKAGTGLEGIADVLRMWFKQPDFRGCAFINTVAENGLGENNQCLMARDHKKQLEVYIEKLAARLKLKKPKEIAAGAMILIEGTIVRAQITGNPDVALTCKQMLKNIRQT